MLKKNTQILSFNVYTTPSDISFLGVNVRNQHSTHIVPVLSESWHVDYDQKIGIDCADWICRVLTDDISANACFSAATIRKIKRLEQKINFNDDNWLMSARDMYTRHFRKQIRSNLQRERTE